MWAAWSQSLDIVKLLVRNRADTTKQNRNGCSVAHWAASGGGKRLSVHHQAWAFFSILIKRSNKIYNI